jgi:serine/threonine protein kinase
LSVLEVPLNLTQKCRSEVSVAEPQEVVRVRREIQLLRVLKHSNIVQLYQVHERICIELMPVGVTGTRPPDVWLRV